MSVVPMIRSNKIVNQFTADGTSETILASKCLLTVTGTFSADVWLQVCSGALGQWIDYEQYLQNGVQRIGDTGGIIVEWRFECRNYVSGTALYSIEPFSS